MNPAERLYWLFLLTALGLAWVAYRRSQERSEGIRFMSYAFPRAVWLHRSAVVDYFFVAITMIVWHGWVSPRVLDAATVQGWVEQVGDRRSPGTRLGSEPSLVIVACYTVVLSVADDFRRYAVHRLFHSVPVLWEFHKVHHSARVLTPVTVYREHPVEVLIGAIAAALTVGLVTGLFVIWWPQGLTPVTILGANAVRFIFDFFGANLRHSHIWLRFGTVAEHVVISPAQHQIHHSCDRQHYDRNFGSQFAIWDWMFGTLYIPASREHLVFGLGPGDDERLSGLHQLYLNPFVGAWRVLVGAGAVPSPDKAAG